MKHSQSIASGMAVSATALSLVTAPAFAQTPGPAASGSSSAIVGLIILVAAVVIAVGIAVRLYDLGRRREQKALELQSRLSDAFFMSPSLSAAAITPTVYAPLWSRGPITIDVAGSVPSPELRDAALELVRRETSRSAQEVRIEDRILINPAMARSIA